MAFESRTVNQDLSLESQRVVVMSQKGQKWVSEACETLHITDLNRDSGGVTRAAKLKVCLHNHRFSGWWLLFTFFGTIF